MPGQEHGESGRRRYGPAEFRRLEERGTLRHPGDDRARQRQMAAGRKRQGQCRNQERPQRRGEQRRGLGEEGGGENEHQGEDGGADRKGQANREAGGEKRRGHRRDQDREPGAVVFGERTRRAEQRRERTGSPHRLRGHRAAAQEFARDRHRSSLAIARRTVEPGGRLPGLADRVVLAAHGEGPGEPGDQHQDERDLVAHLLETRIVETAHRSTA